MKKIKSISIPVFLVLLIIFQGYLSCVRATDGDRIAQIQNQINQLKIENTRLKSEIFAITSLESIENYAKNQAMIPATITNLSAITVAYGNQ